MEKMQTEILIVGAGLAGFTAAVRAAEAGAKVLLIDKSHGELGDGNVLMASGMTLLCVQILLQIAIPLFSRPAPR